MKNFDFVSVTRIVFGLGQFNRIGELAAEFGRHAFVVSNADRKGTHGLHKRLHDLLASKGVALTLFWQNGEPTAPEIDRGAREAAQAGCDLFIGLGGGSAIDAAKAIAGLHTNGGSALDYMEVVGRGMKISKPGAPFIAVPTTAGTGAEVTRNAVVGLTESGKEFKASIRSEHLLARVALVDAELAVRVSPEITARTGMDALTQLIESYTSTGAQPITDALALQGIRLASRALLAVYNDGGNLKAREEMALAALLSGITLTNAGLGAVHGFAAPLGARFPVPHGTVCAALLPPVIEANIAALMAKSPVHAGLARYEELARILTDDANEQPAAAAHYTNVLKQKLRIPGLSQFGFREADIPEMVALAKKSSSMRYNPIALSDLALGAILKDAL